MARREQAEIKERFGSFRVDYLALDLGHGEPITEDQMKEIDTYFGSQNLIEMPDTTRSNVIDRYDPDNAYENGEMKGKGIFKYAVWGDTLYMFPAMHEYDREILHAEMCGALSLDPFKSSDMGYIDVIYTMRRPGEIGEATERIFRGNTRDPFLKDLIPNHNKYRESTVKPVFEKYFMFKDNKKETNQYGIFGW